MAEVCVWWLISSGSGFITTPTRCPREQGLWSHFKRLMMGRGVSHGHLKQGSRWEQKTASISWINQYQNARAKNLRSGDNWEVSQKLQESWQQG